MDLDHILSLSLKSYRQQPDGVCQSYIFPLTCWTLSRSHPGSEDVRLSGYEMKYGTLTSVAGRVSGGVANVRVLWEAKSALQVKVVIILRSSSRSSSPPGAHRWSWTERRPGELPRGKPAAVFCTRQICLSGRWEPHSHVLNC